MLRGPTSPTKHIGLRRVTLTCRGKIVLVISWSYLAATCQYTRLLMPFRNIEFEASVLACMHTRGQAPMLIARGH